MDTQHALARPGTTRAGARAIGDRPYLADDLAVDKRAFRGEKRVWETTLLLIAPAVMAAGLIYHPTIGNPTDPDFLQNLGDAVVAGPLRWAVAHHLVALGSALIALAFLAVDGRLRAAGEVRAAKFGFPFIVAGSLLYALAPAMEFAPLAAAEIGADPSAAQGAILPWFAPTLFGGGLVFAVGSVAFALAIRRGRALDRPLAGLVATGILVAAACRLMPINVVHMDVQAIAGLVALWPLAYVTWTGKWRVMR